MQYIVIENDERREFLKSVEEALAEGWQLHGGVCAQQTYHPDSAWTSYWYAQALVKREDGD